MTDTEQLLSDSIDKISELSIENHRLKAQIEQMSTDYAEQSRTVKMYSDQNSKLRGEFEDMHLTFDSLGVPRCLKDTSRDMSLTARFALFLAQRSGVQVKQDPNEEDCDW